MQQAAFRRRILIEPAPNCVVAELEDDWHRMVVTVRHENGIARTVEGEMKRWPWTTCPGAIAKLSQTFNGQALSDFAKRGEKTRNCTHLHDLAVFAAGHADSATAVAYDISVSDPVDGRRTARLMRDGADVREWTLAHDGLLDPPDLAGQSLYTLNDWIGGLAPAEQEAARILRWAAILAFGRAMDIPEGLSATAFPAGSCFTFQPDMASTARRRADVSRDFSTDNTQPMADRSLMFRLNQETLS